MELIIPTKKYKTSFLYALKEFNKDNPEKNHGLIYGTEEVTNEDFEDYLIKLEDYSKNRNLLEGHVPSSEFWLIDNNEFIGRINIRHELNENLEKIGGHIGYAIRPSKRKMGYGVKILELGLLKAKELGLRKILITCDKDNIGSVKIIEKNNGILENEVSQGENKAPKLQYWITI